MDLEYVKGKLFIRIYVLNDNTYKKFGYLKKVLNKHKIKYVIVKLSNIESNSNLTKKILCIKKLLEKWGGKLYFGRVKT